MARKLENQTNILAPSSDFPNGRIKNAPSGVPVDEKVYGDYHQYFYKILRKAGITANDLADSVSNTFQHFEAINQLAIAPQLAYHGIFNENLSTEEMSSTAAIATFVTNDDRAVAIGNSGGGVFSAELFNIFNGATTSLFTFGAGILNSPTDAWFDTVLDRIYVTDQGTNEVHVFDGTTGVNVPAEDFGSGVLTSPQGIFIRSGKAYVADGASNLVRVFTVSTGASIPAEDIGFGIVTVARDVFLVNDKAYILDSGGTEAVRVFRVSDQASLSGENMGSGLLVTPKGIHIVGEKAYVTDNAGSTPDVFVFDVVTQKRLSNDEFLTGILNDPQKLFIRKNKAYVADTTNGEINVFNQNHAFEHA